ncbi:hypothetical protein JZ751_027469 [Albula glossodonta]|uniref:Thyroid hormone receptor interactor 10 n=1 Tax=Albula glossodonta TaxID=121402 RepID=A0A8T2NJN9_9TELE|nr:hypothetical protein JZ751_027469 [Albula glossodonta]
MDWGTDLWKYVKFVKERTEVEQNYAKQLRNLTKKYSPKRGSKEEQECRFSSHQSFMDILNEVNDYAGQREVIAENMILTICLELSKYLQDLKQERKTSKKRFEREWREAEKASQYAEKTDQDINATKADVEKKLQDMDERRVVKLGQGYVSFADTEKRVMPIISKCLEGITKAGTSTNEKNDSLALIEQHKSGFERPGDLEFEDYSQGINRASSDSSLGTPKGPLDLLGKNKNKLWPFSKKSKLPPPPLTPFSSPPSPANGPPSPKFARDPLSYCLKEINKTVKPRISSFRTLKRTILTPGKYMRRKRLQQKIDDIGKELQKEVDQSEALEKMKDVYEKNPQMGDPSSLEPQISQTGQNIERLRGELQKYESWLTEAGGRGETINYSSHSFNNNGAHDKYSPDGAHSDESSADASQAIYAEFDDDFDEEEIVNPIGECTALYSFQGASEGTIPMQEGEVFAVVEEDKGDGWTRVRRNNGDEGYIPTSYVNINLRK